MWTENFQMYKLGFEEVGIKLPTIARTQKKQENSRKTSTPVSLTTLNWLCGSHNLWKIKEMRIPDHLTCLLRNQHAGQESTVRTRHGTNHWSKVGKEYDKAVYCHPAYLYAEYIIQNARLDQSHAGIKIAGRNINLRYAGLVIWALKSLQMVTAATKLKDAPWKKSYDQLR